MPGIAYETWDSRSVVPTNHMSGETATVGADQHPATIENHRLEYQAISLDMLTAAHHQDPMATGGVLKDVPAIVVDLTVLQATSTNDPMRALLEAVDSSDAKK